MGLRSAFESILASSETLTRLDELIWQSLIAGARSKKHPWNEGCFSTVDVNDLGLHAPRTRTVILRGADRGSLTIDLHTDLRSAKVRQLQLDDANAEACWLFYKPSTKIQLRLEGTARLIDGDEADEAWRSTPLKSRSAYVSIESPGVQGLDSRPPDTSDRIVTFAESERGRVNFRIIRTTVRAADWLYLRPEGHVRAKLDYPSAGIVSSHWIVP